ncbi:MAG: hypothetical protein GKR96_10830 [Gammaproteobacteria bacterium]|nr:hypothetical protein [Gammaproteobacteria bacterium]
MGQKVFIPITDEVLYEYPELITSPLRPYQIDSPCFHWMATIEDKDGKIEKKFDHRMSTANPSDQNDQSVSRFA